MSLYEENAAILRNMEAKGSDLGSSRVVDFSHVFPDRASAQGFARAAEDAGFSATVYEIERGDDPWDVTASREMFPTCENITDAEEYLDGLARAYQGRADGWGFFRA